jgi:hypothetical protein
MSCTAQSSLAVSNSFRCPSDVKCEGNPCQGTKLMLRTNWILTISTVCGPQNSAFLIFLLESNGASGLCLVNAAVWGSLLGHEIVLFYDIANGICPNESKFRQES